MIDVASCTIGTPVRINLLGQRALRPTWDVFDLTAPACPVGCLAVVIDIVFSAFYRVDVFPRHLFLPDELDPVVDPRPNLSSFIPEVELRELQRRPQ